MLTLCLLLSYNSSLNPMIMSFRTVRCTRVPIAWPSGRFSRCPRLQASIPSYVRPATLCAQVCTLSIVCIHGQNPKAVRRCSKRSCPFSSAFLGARSTLLASLSFIKNPSAFPLGTQGSCFVSSSCDHKILSLCSPLAVPAESLQHAVNRKGAVAHLGPAFPQS